MLQYPLIAIEGYIPIDLESAAKNCGLLGDATRIRLLALLEREELTVAELAAVTRLAQPRVSTHLAKLREAGLVSDRRAGVSVFYRIADNNRDHSLTRLWHVMRKQLDDGLLGGDRERLAEVLLNRKGGGNWPESVAGDMERHYSPGRTWESTTRALARLIRPGKLLDVASGDGIMAELLADQAERIDCIDVSEKIVTAGTRRMKGKKNVFFRLGDMHALPFEDNAFDTVLLLHALTYSDEPQQVVLEASRVLAGGGRLLGATIMKHKHEKQVTLFGHANLGFTETGLKGYLEKAGLKVVHCRTESTEHKPPHFQIIIFLAEKA